MELRWIRHAELTSEPWANGAGLTSQIASDREGADGRVRWRLSVASLSESSIFSSFPGVDRVFTVVGDHGVDLDFGTARRHCNPRVPVSFPGEPTPECSVTRPSRAFNVMVDRDQASAKVLHHRMFEGSPVHIDTRANRLVTAIFLLSGTVRFSGIDLLAGDTVVTDQAGPVEGAGEILLVTIDRRAVAAAKSRAVDEPSVGEHPTESRDRLPED